VLLGDPDQEGVVLAEEPRILREVRHEQGLEPRVVHVARHDPVSREDAARVGVHDEHRPARRVEEDGIRGLGPDARDRQEFRSELVGRPSQQPAEALVVPAREVTERALQIDPRRPLREDSSDDDLERRATGPPLLGAVPSTQAIVKPQQPAPEAARRGKRAWARHGSALAPVALAAALGAVAGVVLAPAQPLDLAVAVGGTAQEPAYLPVHAAAALGTFEAEGVRPGLSRAKHPTAAINALRGGEAAVAVTTSDQALRGAWARGKPVRIVAAHTEAPAVALVVSPNYQERLTRVEDLRRRRVGLRGPGTTGHFVLGALLAARRIGASEVEMVSATGAALVARLASGDLAAAVLDEPWLTRALDAGARLLLDLRRPDATRRELGGPFYEVVSVTPADAEALAGREAALAAYARALVRVQAWLAATPAAAVADRLPADLVGDRERFVARLEAVHQAYAPRGEATEEGLAVTFRVLRSASPWPVGLTAAPKDLLEPAFVTGARTGLGPTPPPP
jgi:NitT/TauT family transport system substrate-binding protein